MDEELIAEERECRPWEELIKNQLQEQEAKSSTVSENVSRPFAHTLPRTSFPTSSLYNAVPQETLFGMPTFSTPALTGQGETWNTTEPSEQSGMIRSFSNFETNQPQGQDQFGQNWSLSALPAFDTFPPSDQTASGRFPAVPSTYDRFNVYPNVSVPHETISYPNVYHSYHSNASNSELVDNCQGYFEHPDFRNSPQCQKTMDSVEECFQNMTSGFNHVYTEERTYLGIHNSSGLWRNTLRLVDPPSGKVSCDKQNPASQKNLDIPGTCSISNIGWGAVYTNHVPKHEAIRQQDVKHGVKETLHFTCDYCSKRFRFFSELKSHIRGHTGQKTFKCKVCYRVFSHNSTFRAHERVHTGEKPFLCKVCNRGFAHKCILILHQRTHTGEKPFLCLVCNESFACQSNLRRHKRTHKTFNCERCHQSFTSETDLQCHETTDHFE